MSRRLWSSRLHSSAVPLLHESSRDGTRHFRKFDWWVVAGILAAGGVGVLTAMRQVPIAAGLVGALLLVAVHRRSSRGLVVLGLVLPLLPAIRGVPTSLVIAGKNLYFSDILLPIGVGLAVVAMQSPPWRRLAAGAAAYAGVLVLGTAIGLLNGWSASFILRDVRGPLYVLLAYAATVLLYRKADQRVALGVMAGVLWAAGILVAFESFTGLQLLAGRIETVDRVDPGQGSGGLDATRFLVAPKDLALLCCCAGLALLLRGGGPKLWPWWGALILLPSLEIVFFSFSRRAFLALGLTLVFVLVVSNLSRVVVRLLLIAPVVIGTLAVLVFAPIPANSYLSRQTSAFSDRVLTGLSSEARSQDKGLAFRSLENEYAVRSVLSSPAIGLGLGATYRPNLPGQPFHGADQAYGRTYAHNLYLWLGVKMGLLGLVALALFILRPVVAVTRATTGSSDLQDQVFLAVAAGVVGLCAVNWVAPIFNEPGTAIVLGCAVGLLRLRAHDERLSAPAAQSM